ncbi:MAG: aminopeptidase P N-terminal domain-containing protein [Leptospiraceae bacterium]|nr:aminopeptidase P N-terminal domain-containing protein [Leptospiraceae bacterium]
METNAIYQQRRRVFQQRMQTDSVALIYSAPDRIKSNDVHYPYRPDSNLHYLTGLREEEALLVLTKDAERLYLRERDPEKETWDGYRIGVERAPEWLGIQDARPISSLTADIDSILLNQQNLYYDFGLDAARDTLVLSKARNLFHRSRAGNSGPASIISPAIILHGMRLIKDAAEIDLLRKAADVSVEAHRRLMRSARPGMFEYELQAVLLHEFTRNGGTEAYPSIVASGANACVLHYIENNRRMNDGDLLLVDAGAEIQGLNADITRTIPVNGLFSTAQREVYDLVLTAQKQAIEASCTGNSLQAIHDLTVRVLSQGLLDLGVFPTDYTLDRVLEEKAYQKYYMHKTGHWLGRDVHDVGAYYIDGQPRLLENGMVCTVEPGLYFAPENPEAPEAFRGIGVRIEDDVLIQDDHPVVLTGALAKSVDAIEALCQSERLSPV